MTDPTPTPDTLHAAIERLTYAQDDGSEYEHVDGCGGEPTCPACWVESLRAALAASPAPTDSPDEREVIHGPACNDGIRGYSHEQVYVCEGECAPDRPAAVTTPREDERGVFADPPPEDVEAAYASWGVAAAPAVERADASVEATPDRDTLAALIAKHIGTTNSRYLARALTAAGVTLNETATTPTQEEQK